MNELGYHYGYNYYSKDTEKQKKMKNYEHKIDYTVKHTQQVQKVFHFRVANLTLLKFYIKKDS